MVREYIGARYVPKFMGNYDATQEYEALCVVDNGQGTSYITKIPTPAGTPLTDTRYWTIYGASSGAVINLQNQIDTLNGTVTSQGQTITSQGQTITSQGQAITTLEGTVTTQGQTIASQGNVITALETRINSLPAPDRYKFFRNKKILIIGDSLCDPDTNAPNWASIFKSEVETMGGSVNLDFAQDGQSFAGIAQDLTPFDSYSDEWDYIIVALGVNDYQGQWSIGFYNSTQVVLTGDYDSAAGMNLLLQKLRTKFPSALQYYCPPHRTNHQLTRIKYPLAYYRNAFCRIAQYYGMRIIDWSSMPMFAPQALGATFGGYTSSNDELHPTSVYAPILKAYVMEKLMSGGDNDWKDSSDNVTFKLNTALNSSTERTPIEFTSHGTARVRMAITCNVTNSYEQIFADPPIKAFDSIPKWVLVNGDTPALIEPYGGGLIIKKPAGVATITSLYIDVEYRGSYPMNFYEGITD